MSIKIKLKKGDDVIVLTGKIKVKQENSKNFPKLMKAIVSEINTVKKIKNQTIINRVVL